MPSLLKNRHGPKAKRFTTARKPASPVGLTSTPDSARSHAVLPAILVFGMRIDKPVATSQVFQKRRGQDDLCACPPEMDGIFRPQDSHFLHLLCLESTSRFARASAIDIPIRATGQSLQKPIVTLPQPSKLVLAIDAIGNERHGTPPILGPKRASSTHSAQKPGW